MISNVYYQEMTRDWLIATFARVMLWLTRTDTIVCRGCESEVLIEMLYQFTQTGCECGSTKLRAVKRC